MPWPSLLGRENVQVNCRRCVHAFCISCGPSSGGLQVRCVLCARSMHGTLDLNLGVGVMVPAKAGQVSGVWPEGSECLFGGSDTHTHTLGAAALPTALGPWPPPLTTAGTDTIT